MISGTMLDPRMKLCFGFSCWRYAMSAQPQKPGGGGRQRPAQLSLSACSRWRMFQLSKVSLPWQAASQLPDNLATLHMPKIKNEKSAQRGSFLGGHPVDVRGSFARISRPKTSVRAVKILEKKNKHFSADIHDPKARTSATLRDFQKLRSEKLWAEFSFPKKPNSQE